MLTDAWGLYLLVTPGGGRYWRYDYSFHGKRRTLALGVYPDVSLVPARERPQEACRPIAGFSPANFRDAVRKIEKCGAFEIARRLLQTTAARSCATRWQMTSRRATRWRR